MVVVLLGWFCNLKSITSFCVLVVSFLNGELQFTYQLLAKSTRYVLIIAQTGEDGLHTHA